jgi:hypothetical protein
MAALYASMAIINQVIATTANATKKYNQRGWLILSLKLFNHSFISQYTKGILAIKLIDTNFK